ncbi:hypothetical protein HPB50_014504 [Hyalomma asiaticum]|uniref:Uncharacterized protein n=1 Tax=Hyalomma asiaticum TaxID=266040 RepID=A0ACB7SFR1_HYAAI|nr:hypothetical protein HPB50_014504 [Hyalomma asiaticum]
MDYQVEGEDITPGEITEALGWRTAGARKARSQRRDAAVSNGTALERAEPKRHGVKAGIKLGVIKASRMPPLPRVVIRPQGGLNILKIGAPTVTTAIFASAKIAKEESTDDTVCPNPRQNIVVVSTPRRINADRYCRMRQLRIAEKDYEVNAYEAAPDNTAKGVVRGIPIEDGPEELDRKITSYPWSAVRDRDHGADPGADPGARRGVVPGLHPVNGPELPISKAVDHKAIEMLRKENAAMRDLIQRLIIEVHELKKERTVPNVVPAKEPATNSMDEAGTPAAKKRALQSSEGGSVAGQVRSEIKDMMVGMQENIRNLQMAVASLVSKVASIECNVNSIMAASQQQQPQIVQEQLQYNAGQAPGPPNNHHGACH